MLLKTLAPVVAVVVTALVVGLALMVLQYFGTPLLAKPSLYSKALLRGNVPLV
jgi:hypothetical protein